MKHPSLMDPWSRTLAMLDSLPNRPSEANEKLSLMTRPLVRNVQGKTACIGSTDGHCVNIRVLERLSESTLSLSWHDPVVQLLGAGLGPLHCPQARNVCLERSGDQARTACL